MPTSRRRWSGSGRSCVDELRFEAGADRLDALLLRPERARVLYVLAHGAGADMRHAFLQRIAEALAEVAVATFRFQFPYAQAGRRRPDDAAVLRGAVRAAVNAAREVAPELPMIAGGKSMGGRMTTQAQADAPLPGVRGLALLGFPLHPARRPATSRAEHLARVDVPQLYLQGTRDELADQRQDAAEVEAVAAAAGSFDAAASRAARDRRSGSFLPCAAAQRPDRRGSHPRTRHRDRKLGRRALVLPTFERDRDL